MTPQLLPEQKKDLFFTFQTAMKKLYLENFKGFRLLTRTLVRVTVALDLSKRRKKKEEYSQTVNQVFRLFSAAGLLLTHCSKSAKYIVKGGMGEL